MPADRIVLTEDRIRSLKAPDQETMLWDRDVRGFGLRCYPSGLKKFIFQYRAGNGGRGSQQRRITLGRPDRFAWRTHGMPLGNLPAIWPWGAIRRQIDRRTRAERQAD